MKWLVGSVVLLLLAWLLNMPLLAIAPAAVMLLLLVNQLLASSWSNAIEARRVCRRHELERGDVLDVGLQLGNPDRLPVAWCLVEDLLPVSARTSHPKQRPASEGDRLIMLQLSSGSKRTLYYKIRFPLRGYYQIGPLVLETGDVFGLHRRHKVLVEPDYVTVLPKVVALGSYTLASRRPVGEIRMSHRLFEDPTRMAGVRRYEQGDSFRQVHWRATARTGVLHSKTYEPSCVAGVTVLLDFHERSLPSDGEPHRSELAITMAASVTHAVYLLGQQIGLVTNARDALERIRTEGWQGADFFSLDRKAIREQTAMLETSERLRPVVVPTERGPEQFQRILHTLARLERTDGLTLRELIFEAERHLPRNATVLVISGKLSEEDALAVRELKRSGYAVTVLLSSLDSHAFYVAAGPLVQLGIDVRLCANEQELSTVLGDLPSRL